MDCLEYIRRIQTHFLKNYIVGHILADLTESTGLFFVSLGRIAQAYYNRQSSTATFERYAGRRFLGEDELSR